MYGEKTLETVDLHFVDCGTTALLAVKQNENILKTNEHFLFNKSFDSPLDLLQYRRENSAEYLYS